jgi:hypothetical protein
LAPLLCYKKETGHVFQSLLLVTNYFHVGNWSVNCIYSKLFERESFNSILLSRVCGFICNLQLSFCKLDSILPIIVRFIRPKGLQQLQFCFVRFFACALLHI